MFKFASVSAEIKYKNRDDLAIIYSKKPFKVKAVFTKNRFKAAPVRYCIEKLKENDRFNAIIVNSGNANACTGEEGYNDCIEIEKKVKEVFKVENEILIASTGVIGTRLPIDKIIESLSKLKNNLSENNYKSFAKAIMTTDTFPKVIEYEKDYKMIGIAKGAGMIHPNMATMLAFIFTDAKIDKVDFGKIIDKTFNSISVDGDTSTNDSVFLCSLEEKDVSYNELEKGLFYVCNELAKMIVSDGEGATKLIEINVINGKDEIKCKKIAETIAKSPLVKTAFFGNDPNWGRIICAVGYSGVDIKEERVTLKIGDFIVFENSKESKNFSEENIYNYLKNNKNVKIEIDLNEGNCSWRYYTCDLTYDYVKINAEYRT